MPLSAGVGDIFHHGRLPVNAQIGAYYNVVKPDDGPNWQLRAEGCEARDGDGRHDGSSRHVTAVNAKTGTVGLRSVDRMRKTLRVGKDVDPTRVSRCDGVTAQLAEAVAILVEKS